MNLNDAIRQYNENDVHEYIPASFGIDEERIDRFKNAWVHSEEDENRQLDILQEECAELIQAVSKIRRKRALSHDQIDEWSKVLANLVEELAHVAISSAIVSRIFLVSWEEINAEVDRKMALIPTPQIGIDESHVPDFTGGKKNE